MYLFYVITYGHQGRRDTATPPQNCIPSLWMNSLISFWLVLTISRNCKHIFLDIISRWKNDVELVNICMPFLPCPVQYLYIWLTNSHSGNPVAKALISVWGECSSHRGIKVFGASNISFNFKITRGFSKYVGAQ